LPVGGAWDEDRRPEIHHSDGLKAAELMAIAAASPKTNVLQLPFDHAVYLVGLDTPPDCREGVPEKQSL
jgi:hypothetical protein